MSVLEVSSLTQLSAFCAVPSVPQALRRPPVVTSAPEAIAPRTRVRRVNLLADSTALAWGDRGLCVRRMSGSRVVRENGSYDPTPDPGMM
ncbi:hypothetical protein GCM10022251_39830 [Phytohabitans flavus]|uniref:Uncharacterized protein n=1 Tax=Phytohabitans flavus TaxID=1076124 RepID=A0A6F8Y155_9ACTN|nr:hypothetical protein Pflav_061970 [Phytohabitans flavus]